MPRSVRAVEIRAVPTEAPAAKRDQTWVQEQAHQVTRSANPSSHDRTRIRMTSQRDGRDHSVTLAEFRVGHPDGRYRAVCGHVAHPVSLATPPGPRCLMCVLDDLAGVAISSHDGHEGGGHD